MTDSIIEIRLTRNLRYKLTYVKIYETYLESNHGNEVAELLRGLIQVQQAAISSLSTYLRRLDVKTQDLGLDEKLMAHALGRADVKSRLRFVHDGLQRAVSWYKTQLLDKQMAADPELRRLMFELGELEAAKLWRTEAAMEMLKIQVGAQEKDVESDEDMEPPSQDLWRPRLVDDVGRPSWSGERTPPWSSGRGSAQPRPPTSRRKDRPAKGSGRTPRSQNRG